MLIKFLVSGLTIALENPQLLPVHQKLHKSPGKEEKQSKKSQNMWRMQGMQTTSIVILEIRVETLPTHQQQILMCFLKGHIAPLGMVLLFLCRNCK
jgi:hypothetical protein